jgi:sigma-B regulation protein RsbU (phosphoserine phosphatase)
MFASVFFGLLDVESGRLRYVNAGHEPPVVVRSSGGVERLAPTGPALGLAVGAEFAVGGIELAAGDTLVAFTDGATEARNPDGDFFGEERLLSLLQGSASGAAELLDRVEEAVCGFAGEAPAADDFTMLGVRRG